MRSLRLAVASSLLAMFPACTTEMQMPDSKKPNLAPKGAVMRWQARKNADGRIPDGALYREAVALEQRLAAMPLAGGPANWTLLGPGNIGGRIRSILIHPTNPSIMWVGSVGGGVWKTVDAGNSWSMLPDLPVVLAINCMAIDPNTPSTLYAGTGESSFFNNVVGSSNSAVNVGAGVFKSLDGGTTWTQLPATSGAAWNSVNRLTVDKNNPSIVLAATISGIWRSTDGGNNWSQRTTVKTLDLEIDPNDSTKYVAGRADGFAQYSTDGGLTWNSAPQFPSATRIELAYARSAPGTVFAAVTVSGGLRVWRSTNGGQSYAQQSAGSIVSVLGNYTSAIWVDPTNPNIVVAGGLDLYRSTNAGVSFSKISNWSSYPSSAHADHHIMVPHPNFDGSTNRTVFFGTDGGIQRATDVYTVAQTSGWTNMNRGLAITQLYGVAMHPISGVVLGGAQDNGTSRGTPTSGINGWTQPGGGDGSYPASDPNDPNYFYMQYQNIGLSRSSNAGASAGSSIRSGISEGDPNFMAYILLDPNDSNRLYACGSRLWRANNAKTGFPPAWTAVKPALTCLNSAPPVPPDHYLDNPPCNISTVAVAKGDSNVVWVGHNNGQIWYTTNGLAAAPTWTRVDTAALPDRWVSRIAIDWNDHRRVTVSFLGFAPDNVWRTTDTGTTWSPRWGTGSNVLPPVPVSVIVQHRTAGQRYYAGTDLGLFYSEDDGLNWLPSVGGPTIVPIDDLTWRNDKTLVVGTHGRSIWTCDIDAASVVPVGTGCGISGPPNLAATPPVLGGLQSYTLTGAAPSASVHLLVAGGPPSPITIGPCTVQPSLAGQLLTVPVGATNGSGALTANVPVPSDKNLLGVVLTAQELIAAAGGPLLGAAELSNGLRLTLGY
jgi:hypothetical protein